MGFIIRTLVHTTCVRMYIYMQGALDAQHVHVVWWSLALQPVGVMPPAVSYRLRHNACDIKPPGRRKLVFRLLSLHVGQQS